jgi:acyl carrier protein
MLRSHGKDMNSTSTDEVRAEVESRLAEIWSTVLNAEVESKDDFFELGGHSLAAMRIADLTGEAFRVDVPVSAVFDFPTVAAMAEAITDFQQTGDDRIVRGLPDDQSI